MAREPQTTDTAANRIAPAREAAKARSTTKGDAPQALLDRYLIERDRQGRPERFFRDHRARDPMFRDHGRSLSATQAYPDAVADMLKIAQHRGWDRLRVQGDDAFRREVWVQAQALGLEVRGHRPTERDRAAAGPPTQRAQSPDPLRDRLDKAAVIVRGLIADPGVRERLLAGATRRLAERTRQADHDRATRGRRER